MWDLRQLPAQTVPSTKEVILMGQSAYGYGLRLAQVVILLAKCSQSAIE